MNPAHNIYIHVPFCASKCRYCAFYSVAMQPDWGKYTRDICAETESWGARIGRVDVPTIFFGGGTPSLIPTDKFHDIIKCLGANFNIAPDAEITIEANPGTLDAKRLDEFVAAGVNRLSIGVQSLRESDLEFLGRRHSVADARRLIDAAHARGLRVSADFIYGLPGQTANDVMQMCRDINAIGLQHCSMYELTIEAGTPLALSNPDMPSNDEMADMYATIGATLAMPRYEVSNYATPGNECRHNQNVWDGAPYIGIGRGAAGRVFMNGVWYEQRGANEQCAPITRHDRAVEMVITGLRTVRGVKMTDDVRNAVDMAWVAAHPDLIQTMGGRMRATKRGLLTLDSILLELVR